MEITSKIDKKIVTEDKHAPDEKKKRSSIFLITINTNKSYNGISTEEDMQNVEKRFEKLANNLFSDKNVPKILEDIGKPGSNEKKPISKDTVYSVDVKTQIEANIKKKGFLHLHTLIKVVHCTRVRVNLPLMKNVVYKFLEPVLTIDGKFRKPYVNVRGFRNASFQLENYVNTN